MPCQMYQPVLADLKKNEGYDIKFIDIEENSEKASKMNIMSIPVTIIYKDNKEWERLIGLQSKDNIKYLMSGQIEEKK